jgi:predicted membrane protein
MDIHASRTWIIFYLISFVVLLWALFLTTQGVLLGFGLTMVIVIVGLNFVIVSAELKKASRRKEMMKKFSVKEKTPPEDDHESLGVLE